MREVLKCHLNYAVADTKQWEQSAAYFIDTSDVIDAFVKNSGLGFAIPYLHNGQMHDYVPDFIIRLKTDPVVHLILETKGYDPLEDVKRAAAERWVAAVNADRTYGQWRFALVKKVTDVEALLTTAVASASSVVTYLNTTAKFWTQDKKLADRGVRALMRVLSGHEAKVGRHRQGPLPPDLAAKAAAVADWRALVDQEWA